MHIPGMIEVMALIEDDDKTMRASFSVGEIVGVIDTGQKKPKSLLMVKRLEAPISLSTSYEVVMQLILKAKQQGK